MAVDVNSLTYETITPEIMAQMSPSEIQAFKSKLTNEQVQRLAEKFGGSQAPAPDDDTTLEVTDGPLNFIATPTEESSNAETSSGNPSEQKGPITFGRK